MRLLPLLLLLPPLAGLAGQPLALSEAETLWRQHSRELRLARVGLDAARAERMVAGQAPNPDVSLNVLSIDTKHGVGGGSLSEKRMDSIFRLEQLVERGGKRELRVRGADARVAAAAFDVDDLDRRQLGELRKAYYALRLAQDRLALARDAAALNARSLEVAIRRRQAGDLAPVDVSRLQIDLARAESDVAQAAADLEQARFGLAYLVGRTADAADLDAADDWPALEAQALNEAPLDRRPDLQAARRRVEAAEAERDLARARRTRDLTLGIQYEHNMQNLPNDSVGFGVSLPLFINHEFEGEIARAEADLDAARVQYEQQRALAEVQRAQARSALLAARERSRRLAGEVLDEAGRVARAAEFAYQKGAIGLTDLLDARRTARQVAAEAAAARAEYALALSDWQLQADYRKQP